MYFIVSDINQFLTHIMKINVSPFLVLVLALFISCEEDPEAYFLGELESFIPFEGGEQLHYVVNGTEKKVLTATEKNSRIFPSPEYYSEWLSIGLADWKGFNVFSITLQAGTYVSASFDYNYSVRFTDTENTFTIHQQITFNHDFQNSSPNSASNSKVLESLKVRDRTYYNVVETKNINGATTSTLYYCESDGFIKLEGIRYVWVGEDYKRDTITYDLEKIIWNQGSQ